MARRRTAARNNGTTFLMVGALLLILALLFRPWDFINFTSDTPTTGNNTSDTQPTETENKMKEIFADRDYGDLDQETEDILSAASSLEGTPFQSGGSSPEEGFNSSGFTQHVYEETTGLRMPRIAQHQNELGEQVTAEELYPGDLVFFEANTIMSGIYLGHGEFVTASQSNGVETLRLQDGGFWTENFTEGKRLTEEEKAALHPDTYMDHSHPAVRHAMEYLDIPYEFGGNTLEAFDCSFFTQLVFRESMDVYIPRVTTDQYLIGEAVEREDLEPGDILFFSGIDLEDDDRGNGEITHAGIYLGEGLMIHASRTEAKTQISYLNDYWNDNYTGARRYDSMSLQGEHPVVQEAASLLYTPFESGGTSPDEGFNTSGLVKYVYRESLGIDLPDTANAQFEAGEKIERSEMEIGDLVFFEGSSSYLPGIYIGHDQFIIASESSGVTTRHLDHDDFFSERFAGGRRYY
ncbi:C40 family peptidase [Evansella clarkii]|uniref:C40 family peptidase n=1 Tax=Evansella clarkii TaxID=79879 RepID=UPI0009987680|nr:C40 family peptidase [Evansella clarkii]